MYIQDPTLASAFCEAEKEYTEQVENEILARYKELQECGFSENEALESCLLYTSPSPRDRTRSRMPSSA